jgi:hypothetical protein
MISEYHAKYVEGDQIGRGNFGVAIVVTRTADDTKFVAKKIFLSNLNAKDKESA